MKSNKQFKIRGIGLLINAAKISIVVAGGVAVGVVNLASQVTVGKELISEQTLDNLVKKI